MTDTDSDLAAWAASISNTIAELLGALSMQADILRDLEWATRKIAKSLAQRSASSEVDEVEQLPW